MCFLLSGGKHLEARNKRSGDQVRDDLGTTCAVSCGVSACLSLHRSPGAPEACLLRCHFLSEALRCRESLVENPEPSIGPCCVCPRCRAACPRQVNRTTCTPGGLQRLSLVPLSSLLLCCRSSLFSSCRPLSLSLSVLSVFVFLSSFHPFVCALSYSPALLPQTSLATSVRVLYSKSWGNIPLSDPVTLLLSCHMCLQFFTD